MPDVRARSAALAAAASAVLLLAGCGKGTSGQTGSATQSGGPVHKVAPVVAQGAVSVATRNTTRVGGALVAADAAGVARTVYPGLTVATRPLVVVIANERNWPAALAASVFAASPTSAPILYTEGEEIPEVTSQTLHAMDPVGDPALGGAQVIRVGSTTPVPSGYVTKTIPATGPAPHRRRPRAGLRGRRGCAAPGHRRAFERARRPADAGCGPLRRERCADPVRDPRPAAGTDGEPAPQPRPPVDLPDRRLRHRRRHQA